MRASMPPAGPTLAQSISGFIVDTLAGLHKIGGKFHLVEATTDLDGRLITVTIRQIEFQDQDTAVQVVLNSTAPVAVAVEEPETAGGDGTAP
jgi:hypothetical protein